MIDYYSKYGNCYIIKKKIKEIELPDLFNILSKSKYKCFIYKNDINYFIIIINTFNGPAHDIYFDLQGNYIYKLDTITLGILFEIIDSRNFPLDV